MAGSRSNIEVVLSARDAGLSASMRRAAGTVNAFGSSINRGLISPMRGLIGVATGVRTSILGIAGAIGAGALVGSMMAAGREMSRLETALSSISGGKPAQEMEFVRKTAKELGLELGAVAASYQTIAGAAMGTSLEGEKSRKIFLAVSKASAALQLSGEQTQGALLAIGQMMSKGKVSAEELRGQLGERLPGAFQVAAKAMGMTTAEFDKAMASGKIMAEDFLPKFAQALEQRFGEASSRAATGFEAGMNRVGNSLFELQAAFGQIVSNNIFFAEMLNRVSGIIDDQAKSVNDNAQGWLQWGKEAGLAVLQFGEASVAGLNTAYRGFHMLKGAANAGAAALLQAYGVAMQMEAKVASMAAKMSLSKKAREENQAAADEAIANAKAAESAAQALYGKADENFKKMQEGSQTLNELGEKIKTFRQEMEKVEAKPINPVEGAAKKTQEEIKLVNGVWVNSQKTIRDENTNTTNRVGDDWQGAFAEVKKSGLAAASEVEKALDKAARPRTATISVRQVEQRATGGLIGALAMATGGMVRDARRGLHFPGFGGGDRRHVLAEDGEYMLDKFRVRDLGVGTVRDLHRGRYASAVESILDKLPAIDAARIVSRFIPSPATSGYTINVNFALPGGGSIPVLATPKAAAELREAEARWNRRVSHLGARR